MKKRTGLMLFLFIVLAGVLLACTAQAAPMPTETPTAPPPTPTTQPSATARPTAVPTVTPTPLSPDAQALKDIVFSDCIPVEEGLPEGVEIPWNLLVMQERIVYVLNLEDGTMTEIEYFSGTTPEGYNKFVYDFFVSPDGQWLAYQIPGRTKLIVEPAGSLLTNTDADRIVWNMGKRFHLSRWVDNNKMIAIDHEDELFFRTLLLDPVAREENVFLLQDMPNYMSHHWGGAVILTHFLDGEVVPDPTMRRLIYPELSDEPDIYATNTLWDIENGKPIVRLEHIGSYFFGPLWSMDGSNFLILSRNPELKETIEQEWFFVSDDGIVRQVTRFEDVFLGAYYWIDNPSRSWDGRFLVFNFSYKEPTEISMEIVLDVQSNIVEGYCFPSPGRQIYSYSPLWSPDNKYLLISGEDDEEKEKHLLIDVENQVAYKIGQDVIAIGWIAKPEGEQ
jgi:hypothetical protein